MDIILETAEPAPFNAPDVGASAIDAYATVFTWNFAITPAQAPVRMALLDANPNGVFNKVDFLGAPNCLRSSHGC